GSKRNLYEEIRRWSRDGFPFSKPPPSASRPPHRAPASIRDQDTYTETLSRETMRASPDQTVASDAKCNHKGALYRQRATRLGTPVWALFWAHSARFSLSLFRTWNENERRRRFL